MTEQDVADWLEAQDTLLRRAIGEVQRDVEYFIDDWSKKWGFRYETIEKARVKESARVFAKAERKGVSEPDDLLARCVEKDEEMRFPVQDLLGVRVLVLSLNDVEALKKGLEGLLAGTRLYPLGNPEDARVENINENPRPGGYRALHIDGSVKVRVGEEEREVPFEVQVKTLAQHVFGQHTHDEAYVPDGGNEDPRYEHIRELQRALAETLNGADLLLAQTEELAGVVRDEILRREAGEEISPASVANAVHAQFGVMIRDEEAVRWAERSLANGISQTAEFEALIDLSGDRAAEENERFLREHGWRPAYNELVDALLGLDEMRQLDEPVPPNALDELDPEEDLEAPGEET